MIVKQLIHSFYSNPLSIQNELLTSALTTCISNFHFLPTQSSHFLHTFRHFITLSLFRIRKNGSFLFRYPGTSQLIIQYKCKQVILKKICKSPTLLNTKNTFYNNSTPQF